MSKKLCDMTIQELWELFPISLTKHNDTWATVYTDEKVRLYSIFGDFEARISHIGSTAVSGIWAKPIIDILVEIPPESDMNVYRDILRDNGYILMSQTCNRMSFNRGYTEQGFADKVFHLHLRYFGDNDEILFRDYLNAHPNIARDYEQLKLSLWHRFEHNRDGYTEAKGDFIRYYTSKAKNIK